MNLIILGLYYRYETFWNVLIVIGILSVLYFLFYKKTTTHSRTQQAFDNFKFEPDEFYELVKEEIELRQIEGVEFFNISHPETNLLGSRRKYLRIRIDNMQFDVCAAHYGRGSYVSWYFASSIGVLRMFLNKWQYMNELMDKKTYYQLDTEGMVKQFVDAALNQAIERLIANKGVRLPTDKTILTTPEHTN